MISASDRRKALVFACLGATGCLSGWALGEGFLAAILPSVQLADSSPSLVSKPEASAIAADSQAAPPPPPLPVAPSVEAPPPPSDFKERLDRWGAKTGEVQMSLVWNNTNDLDLYCVEPNGNKIYFGERASPSGGELDVDKNLENDEVVTDPVENIFWPPGRAPLGKYRVAVGHYKRRAADPTTFKVNVLVDDRRQEFTGSLREGEGQIVYEFTLGGSLRLAVPPQLVLIPGTSNRTQAIVLRRRISGPVKLRLEGNLQDLDVTTTEISERQDEGMIHVGAGSTIEPGIRDLRVIAECGSVRVEEKLQVEIKAMPPILRISVPKEIVFDPGTSITVPVRIARERFQGPVTVQLQSDAAGFKLPQLEIPADKDEGELALTAEENANPGSREFPIRAAAGRFVAEATLPVTVRTTRPAFSWAMVPVIGVWTGLIASGLALALAVGQSWYLSKRLPPVRQGLILIGGGMLAGLVAGGIGQALFGLLAQARVLPQFGFLIGWLLLGALVGRGIGFFIPNLHGGKAALAGGVGGLLGATAFLAASTLGDFAGRAVGAALLGICLGLVVALIEAAFRDAWLEVIYGGKESRTVNLGPEPIRIGSNSSCTIWTRTEHPVAVKFWLSQGRITRQDVPGNRTAEVSAGHREQIGALEIVVHSGTAAATGTPRAPRVAPPPPPTRPTTASAKTSPAKSAPAAAKPTSSTAPPATPSTPPPAVAKSPSPPKPPPPRPPSPPKRTN